MSGAAVSGAAVSGAAVSGAAVSGAVVESVPAAGGVVAPTLDDDSLLSLPHAAIDKLMIATAANPVNRFVRTFPPL